jgi:hypothetical protein
MKLYPNLKLDTGDSPTHQNLVQRFHFSETNTHNPSLLLANTHNPNTQNPSDNPKGGLYGQQRIIKEFSKKNYSKNHEDPSKSNIRFSTTNARDCKGLMGNFNGHEVELLGLMKEKDIMGDAGRSAGNYLKDGFNAGDKKLLHVGNGSTRRGKSGYILSNDSTGNAGSGSGPGQG